MVLSLLLTGRYLPVVIDNGHNSKPAAIGRIEEIAREELGYVLSFRSSRLVAGAGRPLARKLRRARKPRACSATRLT